MIWHGFKSGGEDARTGASCNTAIFHTSKGGEDQKYFRINLLPQY
jgi:hypothetical protein